MTSSVLIADDHELFRQGLRLLLKDQGYTEVIEASNGREAAALAAQNAPSIVIMDICMPELNGIDAIRQIVARFPQIKVIALSALDETKIAMQCFRAGAMAFLPKTVAFEELSIALRHVLNGKMYLSAVRGEPTGMLDRNIDLENLNGVGRLRPREREVLQLLAEGKSMKEAAATLHISVKTVETHRRNMMEKLHVSSMAELIKFAIREHITPT